MNSNYLLLASRPWFKSMGARLERATGDGFYPVRSKEELEKLDVAAIQPKIIFVTHWSWIIPETIWQNYETIVFHMTDLPFGRGGSPLQNLVSRGYTQTKISAFRCVSALDAGPVYLKRDLPLYGSAEEIFLRAANIMFEMICEIIRANPVPVPQTGEPVNFRRRTPKESKMNGLESLEKVFDHIRMLDAPGYPLAYFDVPPFRLYFDRAAMRYDGIEATVKIKLIEEE